MGQGFFWGEEGGRVLLFLGGPGRAFEQSPEGSEGVRQGRTWGGNRADLFGQL